ncbi:MAG TPA: nuclear transport factor 2 family protein [Pseudonocardiaceae bacterium]
MSDANQLVERYLAAWNETDEQRRGAALRALWIEGGGYADPQVDVRGHEAISAVIAAVHGQFPGFVFQLEKAAEEHHGRIRFSWGLAESVGAESVVVGTDVAVLAPDGRLSEVHGFLDRVPATL